MNPNKPVSNPNRNRSRTASANTNRAPKPAGEGGVKLRARVVGKPSGSSEMLSFAQVLGTGFLQVLKLLVVFALIIGFFLLGLGSGMLYGYFDTAEKVKVEDIRISTEKTSVLDKDGKVLTQISGGTTESEFIPFSEIKNTYIDDAFIAIEDERFLSHDGVDYKRIASAIFSALANGGTPTHGGSTITQQTIKMLSGKDDISAQRKIQEWYNASQLEKQRSKDSIMELYLNLVPMANNFVGVQAAAKAYFNKNAKDLNLSECAILAGIPNRPATYNPKTEYGRRNILRRMRLILATMRDSGKITQTQYDEALNSEVRFDFSAETNKDESINSYFVDYAINEVVNDLVTRKGYSEDLARIAVYNYGLTIETTCDPGLQMKMESVFRNEKLFVSDPAQLPDSPEKPQGAITVLDNDDNSLGYIRAMVGGYGTKDRNFGFNRASDAKRQPGSSIKPIVVYAPALETGVISTASVCDDRELFLDPDRPKEPYPLNYYRKYWGKMSLESAIVNSVNTIAAETYAKILTPAVGLGYLKQSGIDRTDEPYVSGALGGFSHGMSSLEMAGAYSVLANAGLYVRPTAYTRVLNQDGSVLLDNSSKGRTVTQVYHATTTSVMTSLLEAVAVASHNNAKPSNTPAAGKTGTTEDYTDVWFCGYTPYYTAAVWYGYDNANGRRTTIPLIDGKNAANIWRETMQLAHSDLPQLQFERAPGLFTENICTESGQKATKYCEKTHSALLIPNSPANPTEECRLHNSESKSNDGRVGIDLDGDGIPDIYELAPRPTTVDNPTLTPPAPAPTRRP